ncbi:MAG TPA: HAMP domain-containing sensor histidine kinase [Thermoanaerobaculia bacterium]|nr:HAMP domain-containing sensor histidine kinase [Thermoanaerobaculia bacterium]
MSGVRTLRRRIVIAFVTFTAAVCVAFTALAFLFVYVVEDEFFATLFENEAAYVARELAAGREARPRLPFVTLHRQWSGVPPEVRARATPRAREVAGDDGRHYHIRRIALAGGDAWLVGEVSALLVVRPMRGTLMTILLPATAIVLLCSSLVAALVARRSVRQLTALVDAVQRDELPELRADTADHEVHVLATALEAAFERVRAVLQREKAFVGDVSHELRTPIAVIRGAAELLERRDLDPAARAQLARIRDAARSGEEIVELLLALAREETGREPRTEVALLPLVEKLVLRHRHLLGRADVDVHVDIPPRLRVLAPPTAVEVVISNLVTNALRHGGGSIEITAGASSLSVRDTGPGLAATNARGIGLNLVRRLCDVCGFQLSLESTGSGTTAMISFGR